MLSKINPQQNKKILTQTNIKSNLLQTQYIQLLKSVIPIFQKSYEQRTVSDLSILNKFAQKVNFFKEVQKNCSPELPKSLVKFGKVIKVGENYSIAEEHANVDYFIIALSGKFGISKTIEKSLILKEETQYSSFFSQLKKFSHHYLQFLKRKQLKSVKSYKPTKADINSIQIRETISSSLDKQINFIYNQNLNNYSQIKKHSFSIISLGDENFVFYIDLKKICELMRQQYNKYILKQAQVFLTFRCFKLFKKQKLTQMIEEVQIKKLKKNQIIFTQGQQDSRIFILIQGQVILYKKASLGRENPNRFYRNRLSMIKSQYLQQQQQIIEVIPYADFSKVYNSNNQVKNVKLSTISPISILGEQQVISKTTRQTTAKVSSFQAEFYVFTTDQLQKYITNDSNFQISDFLKRLEQDITNKKILYRQEKLGSQVQYLNRNSKSGFYIDQNLNKEKNRKSLIKLNKTIACIEPSSIQSKIQQKSFFMTASFTCHNFEEFFQPKQLNKKKVTFDGSKVRQRALKPQIKSQRLNFSKEERQIIELLHGNQKTFKKFAQNSSSARSETKSTSYSIGINQPLFSPEYFKKQLEDNKRIQNEMKKSKLKKLYNSGLSLNESRIKSKILTNSTKLQNSKISVRRNLSYQF